MSSVSRNARGASGDALCPGLQCTFVQSFFLGCPLARGLTPQFSGLRCRLDLNLAGFPMLVESESHGCEARQEALFGAASYHGMMPSRAASPIGVEENAFAPDARRWRPILVPSNIGGESVSWHPVGW